MGFVPFILSPQLGIWKVYQNLAPQSSHGLPKALPNF
jgi:hypothetical protein